MTLQFILKTRQYSYQLKKLKSTKLAKVVTIVNSCEMQFLVVNVKRHCQLNDHDPHLGLILACDLGQVEKSDDYLVTRVVQRCNSV